MKPEFRLSAFPSLVFAFALVGNLVPPSLALAEDKICREVDRATVFALSEAARIDSSNVGGFFDFTECKNVYDEDIKDILLRCSYSIDTDSKDYKNISTQQIEYITNLSSKINKCPDVKLEKMNADKDDDLDQEWIVTTFRIDSDGGQVRLQIDYDDDEGYIEVTMYIWRLR